jgi:hypothetical protein
MGAMSQLYADTQDHREQIDTLRQELQMAAARFNALAKNEPAGAFRDLYTRWADETRQAAERM